MSSDSGTVEEIEEPQQVVPEPSMDQRETLGDPEAGLCTPQTAPVETSELVSAQSQVVPTCDEAAMTSESCSTAQSQGVPTHHAPAMASKSLSPSSRANPGKDSDFQPGETSETAAFHQPGASAEEPLKEEDQETPVAGARASDSSQSAARTSVDFGCQVGAPLLFGAPDPCLGCLIFGDCRHTYTIPTGALCIPKEEKAVSKHKVRDPSSAHINDNGQLLSTQPQNVCTGLTSAPSGDGEGSLETQVVSGGSSVPCHSPSGSRQPPESGSDSPEVQREHTQEKSDPKDQSSVSQKKPRS